MPVLDVSELNVVIAVLGAFIICFGFISVKLKQKWYLGEALPAVIAGICLGPVAARVVDANKWGPDVANKVPDITLGLTRVVIGIQLVMAGYQLPQKYVMHRWLEMTIILLPIMTIMWLCTTACIILTIPKVSLLGAMVIGSAVTCTDPVLSQAVAKGPFADKFVPRALREVISAEAGSNDGFVIPFLFLASFLIRHADLRNVQFKTPEIAADALKGTAEAVEMGLSTTAPVAEASITPEPTAPVLIQVIKRATEGEIESHLGRLGGGITKAIEQWFVEGWLYFILMSVVIGVAIGYGSLLAIKFGLRRKWIDSESLLLWPTAVGLFTIGVCGCLGTDDLLACFCAGTALNWNGVYLEETEKLHDEVNSCIDVLLNFGGFMYIGTIIPWSSFQGTNSTGITVGRLMLLGVLVLFFRRLPALFLTYKFMPKCIKNWKEALFMGWFGPIGIGAVFYAEHIKHLFPKAGSAQTIEEDNMLFALDPVVYWLALFSIVVHGLSIPALNTFYSFRGVEPIVEADAVEVRVRSVHEPLPSNAYVDKRGSVFVSNRFSRPNLQREISFDLPPKPNKESDMF